MPIQNYETAYLHKIYIKGAYTKSSALSRKFTKKTQFAFMHRVVKILWFSVKRLDFQVIFRLPGQIQQPFRFSVFFQVSARAIFQLSLRLLPGQPFRFLSGFFKVDRRG
jgi:hypothetical protein